jgi:ribosomal protein L34E
MSAAGAQDHFAHTPTAAANRERKATALAAAAASLGVRVYELTMAGGTFAGAERRKRIRKVAGITAAPSVETWERALGLLEAAERTVPGASTCADCGHAVRVVITAAGNRLAIDPFPHPDGRVWPKTTPAGQRAVVIAGHESPPEDEPLYRQHSRSCPATSGKRRAEGPRCAACCQPMDGVLAARDPSYRTHPACDPAGGGDP